MKFDFNSGAPVQVSQTFVDSLSKHLGYKIRLADAPIIENKFKVFVNDPKEYTLQNRQLSERIVMDATVRDLVRGGEDVCERFMYEFVSKALENYEGKIKYLKSISVIQYIGRDDFTHVDVFKPEFNVCICGYFVE